MPRMFFLVPDPAAAAAAVAAMGEVGPRGAGVMAVAAATAALQPMCRSLETFDFNALACGGLAAVVWLGAVTSGPAAPAAPRVGAAGWALRVLAFVYAALVIPLGLMDMGSANMFSSLRMHGGSNHLFLPSNLLQRYFLDAEGVAGASGQRLERPSVRIAVESARL